MCYFVCGMVHIKEPLLLIEKSSPFSSGSGPLSKRFDKKYAVVTM